MTDTSLPPDETTETPTDEAAETPAEETSEISETEGHVHDLLARLRLDVSGTHVATVLQWLDELSGNKPEPAETTEEPPA